MTITDQAREGTGVSTNRVAVISMDSHVAPPVDHFRPFVPTKYLEAFDEFASQFVAALEASPGAGSPFYKLGFEPSERSRAYWAEINDRFNDVDYYASVETRLASMDDDGVAAEFIFHGGHNRFPQPFSTPELPGMFSEFIPSSPRGAELRIAGIRIYNDWLASWTDKAPDRLFGMAYVPIWDVEESAKEVERARKLGLHGVNLPAPKVGLPTYNVPAYDPFWDACERNGMSLHSHVATGDLLEPDPGPGFYAMRMSEQEYGSRRHLWHLIFGGVFERFPGLKLAFTEQSGTWEVPTLQMLDSVYFAKQQERDTPYIRDILPRRPSDYFMSNVFIGASCVARFEVQAAIDAGYDHKMMWGRDYPHPEGTWPCTKESLRFAFAGFPNEVIKKMLGKTAAGFLDVDIDALASVVERIGPTMEELQEPLDERPAAANHSSGFRQIGPYA